MTSEKAPTARDQELHAAGAPPPSRTLLAPGGEALAMLVRRGFQPSVAPLELPFAPELDEASAERISERLGHYAFRLFLRGAIQQRGSFTPEEATRYVEAEKARAVPLYRQCPAGPDANVGIAIAEGFRALAPPPP